jgi:hypothetical protein
MAQLMETFTGASEAAGTVLERVENTRKRHETLQRALKGLGFSALWGLAAGAAAPALAIANIYKVPMVLALAAVVALPAVLVTRHLLRITIPTSELCAALVTSLYRASLLLVGLAPLLGVYAYTSQWFAPVLAQASALLALVCGGFSLRHELARIDAPRRQVLGLGLVTCVTVGLALFQLVALATPVLTVPTVFGHGIDGVLR